LYTSRRFFLGMSLREACQRQEEAQQRA